MRNQILGDPGVPSLGPRRPHSFMHLVPQGSGDSTPAPEVSLSARGSAQGSGTSSVGPDYSVPSVNSVQYQSKRVTFSASTTSKHPHDEEDDPLLSPVQQSSSDYPTVPSSGISLPIENETSISQSKENETTNRFEMTPELKTELSKVSEL